MSVERVCLECTLFQCDETDKQCKFTQITRIKMRMPTNLKIWRQNLVTAREVRSGRSALGMKKYDRRFKFSNGKGI